MTPFTPSQKIPIGILGATGMVGQNYLKLLINHPWFEIKFLAASERSAGKTYDEATSGKWILDEPVAKQIGQMIVHNVTEIDQAKLSCNLVFSCFEGGSKQEIQDAEIAYAKAGLMVVSNASAHRWTGNVPILVPEINPQHLDILDVQKKTYGFEKGGIVVKPNCSIQTFMLPLQALKQAGYEIKKVLVTTLQASSGAGYPGVPSLDLIDNIVPFIGGEEDKTENEPLKIWGQIQDNQIQTTDQTVISATCTRVPVISGHTASVSLEFGDKKPTLEQIQSIWDNFQAPEISKNLPSSPKHLITYKSEENRPQPRRDRNLENGMGTVVGRLRKCSILDIKFVCLSHNLVRGAAGGGVLNAELLVAKGLV
jgi:aspartate-semialdehyde dehydrogenase